ncbi:FAD/FMN-containing dehydrogenase [Bosea sp. OK403]|uniref:FAD-binding and (Fe-S)-binding domain-containing protein n=1 Tax=Bosea sp. OK403 TaxID=1855286 RepID=UPI0008DF9AED|nr:FAD-binding and (Fe-S)-binding domain-containing protein [Bosea sp. OK403]SFJ73825.1 FAD/FMN-containing dehydrogenase [Bosea sp. OK403]
MIPRLAGAPASAPLYAAFLAELRARGFQGELSDGIADRTVLATDNSIYHVTPEAIAFPCGTDDLLRIVCVAGEERFRDIRLAPRGGGTGTNAQSLTDGLVVDVSRHMTRILDIDIDNRRVRVQAGVVKDQLNAALKPYGLFFAPELSTSNRATIGGMINTDACGQGSCLYGKTRDHVLALTTVLLDGTVWTSRPMTDEQLSVVAARPDRIGAIHELIDRIQREKRLLISARFPRLNRSLTGYDLANIRTADGRFDLNAILCGAEGTLGFVAEAELNVLPIPNYAALITIRYGSFDSALRDARGIIDFQPASIETVDSKVLALARNDIVWQDVQEFFPDDPEGPAEGINLVEFLADDLAALESQIQRALAKLEREGRINGRRGFTVARNEGDRRLPAEGRPLLPSSISGRSQDDLRPAEDGNGSQGRAIEVPSGSARAVERIWSMRKKAVGLLGNMQGRRRPIPFVEDTAVPPEHLADYIAEFRAALDRRGLAYGMFGHVDAGVLHVRPAIDMTDPKQEFLIRDITDEVAALTRKYGGVLWGEHGKGVRSEYAPAFFGPLYPCLQEIKAAFDPRNQLNPGKIAAPAGGALLRIDEVPTRGARERVIAPAIAEAYDNALYCNGNGACYNWDPDDAMCPSWKETRERRHSPKGRAQLMREWLRQLAMAGVDPVDEAKRLRRGQWHRLPNRIRNSWARRGGEADFSHDVKEAMDGCLACKSCVGQCPVKVNVPAFRSKFLQLYYGRYLRPARDYLVGSIEHLVPWAARTPGLYNAVTHSRPGRALLRTIGLVATPSLSKLDIKAEIRARGVAFATSEALSALTADEKAGSVVIVQDAFTSFYETPLLLDLIDFIQALGYRPFLAPYRPNGKALYVHGFLKAFGDVAMANSAMLAELSAGGVALVGLDPSITLTYRSEYAGVVNDAERPRVLLVQEWLAGRLNARAAVDGEEYLLLPHCTERTNAPVALRDWETVFAKLGLRLRIAPSGCCGMAGTWGHEAEHRDASTRIYAQSWARHVAGAVASGRLMADGYSCRSQAALIDGARLPHPVQVLLAKLTAGQDGRATPS